MSVEPEQSDVKRFELLLEQGRSANAAKNSATRNGARLNEL
jgi:hypothetical protein